MSKYLTFPEAAFHNRDLLVEALVDLGWERSQIQVSDTPQPLHGHHGDVRAETAEVVIPRKHVGSSSNDLGFKLNADGAYVPVISEYDHRYLQHRLKVPNVIAALRTHYNEKVAFAFAAKMRGGVVNRREGAVRKITVSI